MSNHLAFATVTETLRRMLDSALKDGATGVNGASATAVRPSGAGGSGTGGGLPQTGANVYLYQVTPNPAGRNLDLPTRRHDGGAITHPQAAFDLHYLISVYGSDLSQEAQRVLGVVTRALHTRPLLTRDAIDDAVGAAAFLVGADLSAAPELVRFTPQIVSLEELSRIWGVFYQVPYMLSVCYQASVVFIEETTAPVTSSLPVRERRILGLPLDLPRIDSLSPQPALAGGTLTIAGPNVGRGVPRIRFGDATSVPATVLDSDRIQVTLPATVQAGVSTLRVLRNLDLGTANASEPHAGFESNVVALALAPRITSVLSNVARGTTLLINVDAPVGRLQRVALLLDSRVTLLPTRSSDDPATTTQLGFKVPSDMPTGPHLVRVQVDGVDSPLVVDTTSGSPTFGQYVGPRVTVT